MSSGCWGALRGTGPRATGVGARFFRCLARDRPSRYGGRGVFFVVRGAVSRDCCDSPRHGQGQALSLRIKVKDTVVRGPVPRNRHLILAILIILAILLQTERVRGTGPRTTGAETRFFYVWKFCSLTKKLRYVKISLPIG